MLNYDKLLKINSLIKNDDETYSNKNKLIKEYIEIKNLKLKEMMYSQNISLVFIIFLLSFYFKMNNSSELFPSHDLEMIYAAALYSISITFAFLDLFFLDIISTRPIKYTHTEYVSNLFKTGSWGLFFSILVLLQYYSESHFNAISGNIFLVILFLHTCLNCLLLIKNQTKLRNKNDIKKYKKRYLKTSLSKNIKNKTNLENEIINNIKNYYDYIYFIGLVENEKLDNLKYLIPNIKNHLIKTYDTDDFNVIREKSEKRAFVLNY